MSKVVVIVGHSTKDTGATSDSGISEYVFNDTLANQIKERFFEHNMTDDIVILHRENGLKALPDEANALNPKLIVSLHCNAFDTNVSGCEMLYYHKSTTGKEVARIFQNKIVKLLDHRDRGLLACSSEDRGGYLLRYTQAPCIIAEPFFIDNFDEYLAAKELLDDGSLADTYCECINEALKVVS